MPVEAYMTDKRDGKLYGPHMPNSFADLDTMMREELGLPPNNKEWIAGWGMEMSILGGIAWNNKPEDMDMWISEATGPHSDDLKRVWAYLKEHFTFANNWGDRSVYK